MLDIDRLILRLPPELAGRKRIIARALADALEQAFAGRPPEGGALGDVSLPPIRLKRGESNAALVRRITGAVTRSVGTVSAGGAVREPVRPRVRDAAAGPREGDA